MVSESGRMRNVSLIGLNGTILLYTDENKNCLLHCCNSNIYMVDKSSSQSIGRNPAKQKCVLRKKTTSYFAFTSAVTKSTDGESISHSADANHLS